MQFNTDTTAIAVVKTPLCIRRKSFLVAGLLLLFTFFSLTLHAQEDAGRISTTVNIGRQNGSVSSLLENLEKQTGYIFFYDKEVMNNISVNQHFGSTTLGKVLQWLQQNQRLAFKVNGKNIAVRVQAVPPADASKKIPGKLEGIILDIETGEPVNGANVQVGGISRVSNIDGFFSIGLPEGNYSAQVSFVGYSSKKITELIVRSGITTTTTFTMNRQQGNLSTVTVQASLKKDGISGLLVRQKNNASITDGISAEQIGRTPDKNIGEVLKRVSGLSTIDNRYVVVRGLSERYNGALLNGQIMPSTELNRKNFNYEMIPANMVENVVVNKTITPDMSAEFGGGLVQVNTRTVPMANFATITAGVSANEKTTGKDFLGLKISGRSYLAQVSDDRKLLGKKNWNSFSEIVNDPRWKETADNSYELKDKRDFSPNWNLYRYQPLPSLNVQGAIGKVIPWKEDRRIGLMASLSYRNNWQTQEIRMSRDGYFKKDADGQLAGYNGKRYGFTANLSGIAGAGLTTARSKYYYQLLYLSMLDQHFMVGTGITDQVGEAVGYYDLTMQTSMWQQQLRGEHSLGKKGLKFNWAASYLLLDKQKPDNHFFTANYVGEGKDKPGTMVDFTMSNALTFGGSTARSWNRAYEKNLSWNVDVAQPFAFKLFNLAFSNTLKTGYAGWRKDRKFWVFNSFALGGNGNKPMPLSEYFAPENIQAITVGRFGDDFPAKNKPGYATLHAGFIMLDQKIAKKLRLVYGLRAEYYNLNRINTAIASALPNTDVPLDFSDVYNREPNWNYFPSLNITYSLNTSMNLRLAYSKSIIRPDLRELSWFKEYDFELGGTYESNGQLVSTKIDHYDFKFEWYPSAGELISLSLFYKKLKYPMEIYANLNRTFELRNDKDATNKGIELELRKSLGFTGIPALKGLTLFGNFTRLFADVRPMKNGYNIIDQKVVVSEVVHPKEDRPQTGASNYMYNAGMYYDISPLSFSATWNFITNRTYRPSELYAESLFEQPVQSLDAQVSCKLLRNKALLKLSLSNLLKSYYVVYSNTYEGGSSVPFDENHQQRKPTTKELLYDKGNDLINYESKAGRSASLSFTYNF